MLKTPLSEWLSQIRSHLTHLLENVIESPRLHYMFHIFLPIINQVLTCKYGRDLQTLILDKNLYIQFDADALIIAQVSNFWQNRKYLFSNNDMEY